MPTPVPEVGRGLSSPRFHLYYLPGALRSPHPSSITCATMQGRHEGGDSFIRNGHAPCQTQSAVIFTNPSGEPLRLGRGEQRTSRLLDIVEISSRYPPKHSGPCIIFPLSNFELCFISVVGLSPVGCCAQSNRTSCMPGSIGTPGSILQAFCLERHIAIRPGMEWHT